MDITSAATGPETRHVPVLLRETLEYLAPKPGGRYLDGTLGLAGHASAMLAAAPGATLLGLDQDTEALALARERLAPYGDNAVLRQSRYSDFGACLDEIGWEYIDGALIDIGVSSLQLDSPERGFSFMSDGPLDMRMDATGINGHPPVPPASALVNKAPYATLQEIIEKYGEEPQAGRIARAIVDARSRKAIETTAELAAIVSAAYPPKWRATARNHPATRTFQALRCEVNNEFGELEMFLQRIVPRLRPGGRVAVITFHSIEDRIVKQFFRTEASGCLCPPHIPQCVCSHKASLRILTKKPVLPSTAEVKANPRAGSAKLRAAERVADGADDARF